MNHPRDNAFSIDLPSETGPIAAMHSHKGYLEIYTRNATYRVETADQVDAKRMVPTIPPAVYSQIASVGASNPIVTRSYLQILEMMNGHQLKRGEVEKIQDCFHDCKEALLGADRVASTIIKEFEKAKSDCSNGLNVSGGALVCPNLPDLLLQVKDYVGYAKLSMQAVGEAFNLFYGLIPGQVLKPVKHGNFCFAVDYLRSLSDPYYDDFISRIEEALPFLSWLINARNHFEHKNETNPFVVENFRIMNATLKAPSWHFFTDQPTPIHLDLPTFNESLIRFVEIVFTNAFLDNMAFELPFRVRIIPIEPEAIDPEFPRTFELQIG